MRNMKILCCTAVILLALTAGQKSTSQAGTKIDPALLAAKEKALTWLKNQKVPNALIPDPQPDRRNLMMSYEIPSSDPSYRYIFGRSVIYDDALASIAFTMQKDYKSASQILLALKRLQRKDGGLWFGYNVNNDWPSENDYDGSTERTGATAWVGYAAVYYLQSRLSEDPSSLQSRESKAVIDLAQSLGNYLAALQIRNRSDLRYGLVTGGKNSYSLKLENNAVREVFKAAEIDWISSEHNIDAYFFLRDLGQLTGKEIYSRCADEIKTGMLRVWSGKDRQYFRGIKPGYIDKALALDCASWGAVFSLSAGKPDYAAQSLEALEKLYLSSTEVKGKELSGYKPYADKEIYEDGASDITKFYFPGLKGTTWDRINGIWVEGSMGAAFAYLKTGNRDKTAEILKTMLPLQGQSGGFIYFTREIPHEFSTYISTASTAWFIMMVSSLEDPAVADGFWRK